MWDFRWPWSRRTSIFDPPTLLDNLLSSPLRTIVTRLYRILLTLRGAPFKPPRNRHKIRFVCISDTHTNAPPIPEGDILIHAGDLTNAGTIAEIQVQLDWLASQPHEHKIVIAGNHDSYFDPLSRKQEDRDSGKKLNFHGVHYLENEALELTVKGRTLTFYGAPAIPQCGGSDFAFQYPHDQPPWKNQIPISTDILITHTPPRLHLDNGLGCAGLLEEMWRVRPRLHVFGHIHAAPGREALFWDRGQEAYEKLIGRWKQGLIADCLPSAAWMDTLRVLWHGVMGVLWQRLMVGSAGANGCLLVNAAVVSWRSADVIGNKAQVVDL